MSTTVGQQLIEGWGIPEKNNKIKLKGHLTHLWSDLKINQLINIVLIIN